MVTDQRFDTWESFFYPGTQTFVNKAGIQDFNALATTEYRLGAMRQEQLQRQPIAGNFDLAHLAAIHQHLFQDLYSWAGQVREVDMAKRNTTFTLCSAIQDEAQNIHASLLAENLLQGLAKPDFVQSLAAHYAALNALHPFREGNGRATRVFLSQLAAQAGYALDVTRFDQDKARWNRAAEVSIPRTHGGPGDLSQLTAFFTEAVRPSRAVAFERLLPAIALQDHPELAGAFAELQAAQDALRAKYPTNPQARDHFMRQAHSEMVRKLDAGQIPGRAPLVAQTALDVRDAAVALDSDAAMRAEAATAALSRADLDALAHLQAGRPVDAIQRAALVREGLVDPVSGDVTPAGSIAGADHTMRHPQFRFRDYVATQKELRRDLDRAPSRGDDLGR